MDIILYSFYYLFFVNYLEFVSEILLIIEVYVSKYTQCTVKLRSNFQKIAQLKCTTNEKRNLSERNLTVH